MLVWLAVVSCCAAANYTITDLGPVPFKGWLAINNQSQVLVNKFEFGAFIYDDGVSVQLPTSTDAIHSRAFGIGPTGDVAIGIPTTEPAGFGLYSTAAVYSSSGVSDLGIHDGISSSAFGINGSGQVVGGNDPFAYDITQIIFDDPAVTSPAFLYDGGVFQDLGTLGGLYSLAYDINESGQIVGFSTPPGPPRFLIDPDWESRAFLYDNGSMQDLNSLAGAADWTLESALSINDAGQVVGYGELNGASRGYLYDDGSVVDMGVLPGFDMSIARDVNALGDVVGTMSTSTGQLYLYRLTTDGPELAFLYRDGTTSDLNSMLHPNSGWVLNAATGINDQGQIVGYGTLTVGETQATHAFLLTPVPEPSGAVLCGLGLLALLGWTARRGRLRLLRPAAMHVLRPLANLAVTIVRRLPRVAAAILVWLAVVSCCAAANYTITDLGPAPDKAWLAINNQSQVLVNRFNGTFVYDDGVSTPLPFNPEHVVERAFNIGPTGDVAGGINDGTLLGLGLYSTAAIYHYDGTISDLGTLDGISASAFGINGSGKIVGGNDPVGYEVAQATDGDPNVISHAFLYENGVFQDLGTLGGSYSLAYDINESGQIVGFSTPPGPAEFVGLPTWESRAFLYDNGSMQDLNSLAGAADWTLESALSINDVGQVVG